MLHVPFIVELTRRDFQERFAGSALGMAWAFVLPLVNVLIYIAIFGKFMGGRLPGTSDMLAYAAYLSVGLIPWTAFSGTIQRASTIFLDKRHLILKVRMSLPLLVVHVALSEAITAFISFVFLLLFLLASGFTPGLGLFDALAVFVLQQFFAMSLGLFLATLTVLVRDLKQVVVVALQFWFWFTPIVYVMDILPDWVAGLVRLNPATPLIDAYHKIFVFKQSPDYVALLWLTLAAHLVAALALTAFSRLEKDVRDSL